MNRLQKFIKLHGARRYEMESRSSSLNDRQEIVIVVRIQMVQLVIDTLDVPAIKKMKKLKTSMFLKFKQVQNTYI